MTKTQHGGPRQNAGRKSELKPGSTKGYTLTLDDETAKQLIVLGKGNRSKGVREAVRRACIPQ